MKPPPPGVKPPLSLRQSPLNPGCHKAILYLEMSRFWSLLVQISPPIVYHIIDFYDFSADILSYETTCEV